MRSGTELGQFMRFFYLLLNLSLINYWWVKFPLSLPFYLLYGALALTLTCRYFKHFGIVNNLLFAQ